MRVEVERELATKMINVYVVQDGAINGKTAVWQPIRDPNFEVGERIGGTDWGEVPVGGQVPPSLRLPEDVWVAMLAAGADVPAPSRAQHDHLADAMAVRDRLLAMVESGWEGMVKPPRFLTAAEAERQQP